jgi:hypothetical protein
MGVFWEYKYKEMMWEMMCRYADVQMKWPEISIISFYVKH